MSNKVKNVIYGCGEIGLAVNELLMQSMNKMERENLNNQSLLVDIRREDFETNMLGIKVAPIECLHICIPYTKTNNFVDIVNKIVEGATNIDMVIIHSTIEPNTTLKIKHPRVAYSPVTGRHEKGHGFVEDIKRYYKWVWCSDKSMEDKIYNMFGVLRIKFSSDKTPFSLEFGKIMLTTYVTANVLIEKYVHDKCEQNGADFEVCYTGMLQNYNDGVNQDWRLPIYQHMKGKIGGHCCLPNLELVDDKFIDLIKELNSLYGDK